MEENRIARSVRPPRRSQRATMNPNGLRGSRSTLVLRRTPGPGLMSSRSPGLRSRSCQDPGPVKCMIPFVDVVRGRRRPNSRAKYDRFLRMAEKTPPRKCRDRRWSNRGVIAESWSTVGLAHISGARRPDLGFSASTRHRAVTMLEVASVDKCDPDGIASGGMPGGRSTKTFTQGPLRPSIVDGRSADPHAGRSTQVQTT